MSIRARILLLIIFLLAVVATGLFLQKRLQMVEIREIRADKERQVEREFDKLSEMEARAFITHVEVEYTRWDEMVEFAEASVIDDQWKEWLTSNIDEAFNQYPYNAIWIFRKDFSLRYSVTGNGLSAQSIKDVDLGGILKGKFGKGKAVHFYLYMKPGLMEIRGASIHPGADNRKETPGRGYYVVGKRLGKEFVDDLSTLTGSAIRILPRAQADRVAIDKAGNREKGLVVFKRSFMGWEGAPVASMIVTFVSPFMKEINQSSRQDFMFLAAFALALVLGILLLLVVWVGRPLTQVSRSLDTDDRGPIAGLKERGDEFGEIAVLIHNFFDEKEELRTARDAAEEATRAKAEFLANMSHEIRTPMNAVVGMTALLRDTSLMPEEKGLVETLKTSGEALLALVNDILDHSKIESGKMLIEKRPFGLRRCVEEAVEVSRAEADSKGLGLGCEFGEGVPEGIVGDSVRLRQVIGNLVGNAVKFTGRGEVRVSVSARPAGGKLHDILVAVRDSGPGIPQDRIGTLFEPFYSPATRHHGGAGLGLAVSKGLVHLMGGSIRVESEEGRGSIFSFTATAEEAPAGSLPDEEAGPGQPGDTHAPAKAGAPGAAERTALRILVAEDNKVNQKVVLKTIEKLGYKADLVDNGLEALRALERRSYDIIFMDVHMPLMDGLEATRRIVEKYREGPRPRIYAMTATYSFDDMQQCLDAGMEGSLNKPIVIDELKELLARLALKKPGS